jgi:hypothetical protein
VERRGRVELACCCDRGVEGGDEGVEGVERRYIRVKGADRVAKKLGVGGRSKKGQKAIKGSSSGMSSSKIHQPRQPSSGSAVNASVAVLSLLFGAEATDEEAFRFFPEAGAAGTRRKR